MLKHTFCHSPRLNGLNEQSLWERGYLTWEDIIWAKELPLTDKQSQAALDTCRRSAFHLGNGDASFFYNILPTKEHWRLFKDFRKQTAYFDIETSGLDHDKHHITTIVLYDGEKLRHYVHGKNLENFGKDIEQYKILVSYNGKSFDAPFIRKNLDIPLKHAHIDLRYVLNNLGYKGGLKSCERQLNIDRPGLEEIDGFMAILLWEHYKKIGNEKALETLLAYNALDVINLEMLMIIAYNQKISSTPFNHLKIPIPIAPHMTFLPDKEIIRKIKLSM
jgi:hypothetical protein